MSSKIEMFVSYAHDRERYLNAFHTHLGQMRNEGLIDVWHDRRIDAGTDWAGAIDDNIERAHVIVLLVTAEFLASNYCYEIEMKRALERHDAGHATVVPIIVAPSDWKSAPFAHLQALPKDGKPVLEWRLRDSAWLDVVKSLRRIIREHWPDGGSRSVGDAIDPHWRKKLDRIEQTATVRYLVDEALKKGYPRCINFCWYGRRQDGVDAFHNRLERELEEVAPGRAWFLRPDWPAVMDRRGFREMLQHVTQSPGEVGAAIHQHFRGRHGRRHLLYVNHSPVTSSKQMGPKQYGEYLRWWDEEVVRTLEPQQCVVVGTSFIVNDPVKFKNAVDAGAGLTAHNFGDQFVFRFLPVLAELDREDLRMFFKLNPLREVDQHRLEQAINRIITDTNGEYDLVIEELEALLVDGLDDARDGANDDAEPDDSAENLGY